MGNMMDNMTSDDLDVIKERIRIDNENGKPENEFQSIHLSDLTLNELKSIKRLINRLNTGSTWTIESWIKYRTNHPKNN